MTNLTYGPFEGPDDKPEEEAFNLGWEACEQGVPVEENPFSAAGGPQEEKWKEGWYAAAREELDAREYEEVPREELPSVRGSGDIVGSCHSFERGTSPEHKDAVRRYLEWFLASEHIDPVEVIFRYRV